MYTRSKKHVAGYRRSSMFKSGPWAILVCDCAKSLTSSQIFGSSSCSDSLWIAGQSAIFCIPWWFWTVNMLTILNMFEHDWTCSINFSFMSNMYSFPFWTCFINFHRFIVNFHTCSIHFYGWGWMISSTEHRRRFQKHIPDILDRQITILVQNPSKIVAKVV